MSHIEYDLRTDLQQSKINIEDGGGESQLYNNLYTYQHILVKSHLMMNIHVTLAFLGNCLVDCMGLKYVKNCSNPLVFRKIPFDSVTLNLVFK